MAGVAVTFAAALGSRAQGEQTEGKINILNGEKLNLFA
jgi:hypothetical protein